MAYLNKVLLIGNIGQDPRTSASPNGRKRVSFSLATSRRYRDNNGEQKEETTWHNIVIWGKAAETFEQLGIGKGISLFIEGELVNRSWTDNQGSKRSITEVNASTFQILTPRGQNASQGGSAGVSAQGSANGRRNPYSPAEGQPTEEDLGDDLPFDGGRT